MKLSVVKTLPHNFSTFKIGKLAAGVTAQPRLPESHFEASKEHSRFFTVMEEKNCFGKYTSTFSMVNATERRFNDQLHNDDDEFMYEFWDFLTYADHDSIPRGFSADYDFLRSHPLTETFLRSPEMMIKLASHNNPNAAALLLQRLEKSDVSASTDIVNAVKNNRFAVLLLKGLTDKVKVGHPLAISTGIQVIDHLGVFRMALSVKLCVALFKQALKTNDDCSEFAKAFIKPSIELFGHRHEFPKVKFFNPLDLFSNDFAHKKFNEETIIQLFAEAFHSAPQEKQTQFIQHVEQASMEGLVSIGLDETDARAKTEIMIHSLKAALLSVGEIWH